MKKQQFSLYSYIMAPWAVRSIPFGIYMIFILMQSGLHYIVTEEVSSIYLTPVIYTLKTLIVFLSLVLLWKHYDELKKISLTLKSALLSILIGGVVFILWINMAVPVLTIGKADVFNPETLPGTWIIPFFVIRMIGASIIVPVFEEIFWRSFILRYIIQPDFMDVKLGMFTWSSFIVSSILFGLEHHLWAAGIMAGLFYSYLLYRTKNLYACILAHGVTNLLLGIYVINTGNWQFW